MKILFLTCILFISMLTSSFCNSFVNKSYKEKHYSYNINTGTVTESIPSVKEHYRVGLFIDTPVYNPPTTGFLYKVFNLSKAMLKRGHSYVFFICNRNFKNKEELSKFKIEGIKVHILDEHLFYNTSYISQLIKQEQLDILQYELAQTFLTLGVPLRNQTNLPSVLALNDMEHELMDVLGSRAAKDLVDFSHYAAGHLSDVLVVLTNLDKEKRISHHGISKEKVFVTPIGVDKSLSFKGANLREKIIGIVGNQFYEPNRRATVYLIEKILPIVKKQHPEAKIKIIGMSPDALQAPYKNRTDIIFSGVINDVKKYIEEVASFAVGTCCIDSGSGMNVKVANYCAVGLPVVLTPICHKGYETITSLQVIDLDPLKIAEKINQLLSNKDYAYTLGQMNHKLIFEHLSWDNIASNLEHALHYAFTRKGSSISSHVKLKPLWILEKRTNMNTLNGHYTITP